MQHEEQSDELQVMLQEVINLISDDQQEVIEGVERFQEVIRGVKRSQEIIGEVERFQEIIGEVKRFQEIIEEVDDLLGFD